jgi:ATP synthase protein I
MSQLGVTMAACVLIGLFIGRTLDMVFGTEPWLLLTFLVFGVMAAFKAMFSIAGFKDDGKDHK